MAGDAADVRRRVLDRDARRAGRPPSSSPARWHRRTSGSCTPGSGSARRHGVAAKYGVSGSFTGANTGPLLTKLAADKTLAKAYAEQLKVVTAFRDGLPEARRALANVATYMICDDHEITDDWNLSQRWKDRVYTSPLGRTVLRNGLLAYLLCQGWGNDPARFAAAGSKAKELLDAVPRLFAAGAGASRPTRPRPTPSTGSSGSPAASRPCAGTTASTARSTACWSSTPGPVAGTARRVAPPTNLPTAALEQQMPAGPLPAGLELLVVVAPLPVFGLPVADELGGPLAYRATDAVSTDEIDAMPGTDPDAAEAWVNDKASFEALLKRLAPYRKVIVLSGDVHYAHSGGASYWKGAEATPSRFAQFTSSGLKNVWPHYVLTLSPVVRPGPVARAHRRSGRAARLGRRLAGRARRPRRRRAAAARPGQAAVDAGAAADARLARRHDAWPARPTGRGASGRRGTRGRWPSARSRPARPRSTRPPRLPTSPTTIEGYRLAARRHARQLAKVSFTSQVLFESNVGVVRFDRGRRAPDRRPRAARPPGRRPRSRRSTPSTASCSSRPPATRPKPARPSEAQHERPIARPAGHRLGRRLPRLAQGPPGERHRPAGRARRPRSRPGSRCRRRRSPARRSTASTATARPPIPTSRRSSPCGRTSWPSSRRWRRSSTPPAPAARASSRRCCASSWPHVDRVPPPAQPDGVLRRPARRASSRTSRPQRLPRPGRRRRVEARRASNLVAALEAPLDHLDRVFSTPETEEDARDLAAHTLIPFAMLLAYWELTVANGLHARRRRASSCRAAGAPGLGRDRRLDHPGGRPAGRFDGVVPDARASTCAVLGPGGTAVESELGATLAWVPREHGGPGLFVSVNGSADLDVGLGSIGGS